MDVNEIGSRIANSILSYFAIKDNLEIIERLREAGLKMEASQRKGALGNQLEGKSIVISGSFSRYSRDEYKRMIEDYSGKNVSSISSNTSFILGGDKIGPSKLKKADELGIEIISEDDFLTLIDKL